MHYKLVIIFSLLLGFQSLTFSQDKLRPFKKKRNLEAEAIKDLDSFFDTAFDYSQFTARVTDRDKTSNILKISSENKNIKFFRSGDLIQFRLAAKKTKFCQGYIRSVEKNYFVVYVKDMFPCWADKDYFRRGTMLFVKAEQLAKSVRDASLYRIVLLRRKKDFFRQLNDVNHFVWSYDQQRIIEAAKFDKKIIEIQKAKQRAMELLLIKKKDSINLQKELAYRLDQLDKDLGFYRIEKEDLLYDRWHLDQGLGLPVGNRPSKIKIVDPDYKTDRIDLL